MGERTVLPLRVRIAYGVWYLIVAGVLIGCSLKIALDSVESADPFNATLANWRLDVVSDLIVVEATQSCSDKQAENFYTLKWQGGQICAQGAQESIQTGSSSTCDGGSSVFKLPQDTMNFWALEQPAADNAYEGVSLCAKRISNYNFQSHAPLQYNTCRDPSTEQLCGDGSSDSFFCVPRTAKCPLNYFQFSQQESSGSEVLILPNEQTIILMRLQQQNNAPALVEVQSALLGGGVCVNPNEQSTQQKNCSQTDNQYVASAWSTSLLSLFTVNSVQIPQKWSSQQLAEQPLYEIYYRGLIALAMHCRAQALPLMNSIPAQGTASLQSLEIAQIVLCSLLAAFLLFAEIVFTCVQVQAKCIGKCCRNSFAAFKYALWLSSLIIAILTLSQTIALAQFLDYLISQNCLEQISASVFTNLRTSLTLSTQKTLVAFLVLYFVFDWQFLLFLRYVYRKSCHKRATASSSSSSVDQEMQERSRLGKSNASYQPADLSTPTQLSAMNSSQLIHNHALELHLQQTQQVQLEKFQNL